MIIVIEKVRENIELLAIKKIDKIVIAEVIKISSTINLGIQHNQAISNADINIAKDFRLNCMKKY